MEDKLKKMFQMYAQVKAGKDQEIKLESDSRPKVLLVDDDISDNLDLAAKVSQEYCAICCTQAEALEKFKENKYLMIVIDNDANQSPNQAKGLETLRVLRALDEKVPVYYTSFTPTRVAKSVVEANQARLIHTLDLQEDINKLLAQYKEKPMEEISPARTPEPQMMEMDGKVIWLDNYPKKEMPKR